MKNKKIIFLITAAIITPLLISAWLLPPEIIPPRTETILVYQGATSGQHSDSVELIAFLSEKRTGRAITNRKIRFVLERQEVSAVTDINGIARTFLRLNQSVGNYTLLIIFEGDKTFHGSSTPTPFRILKEDTILTYTGSVSGAQNTTIALSARLSEIDPEVGNLKRKTIIFELNGLSVQTRTNKLGEARADLRLDLSPGNYTLKTKFPGSATHLSSFTTNTFQVIASPRTGRGECFIATVSFGSPLAEEIDLLRQFRDEYLLTNWFGVLVVQQYEQFSPFLTNFIAQNEEFKKITRTGLKSLIEILPREF
jgi:hypothetical protein